MTSQIRRAPSSGDDQPQATLSYGDQFGPYIITGFAGRGATSYVYRARRRDRFEPVAIKVLHPHLVADPTRRLTFYREARIMMRMEHSNVVRFEEIIEDGETLAFVMEYIDGVTLAEWRKTQNRSFNEMELACVFVDILRGVTAAHRQGVVHRDLKPGNILITEQEGRSVAKIIDFGVARFVDDPLTAREESKIIGTAAYISPEEVADPKAVSEASDLYSIGVMLYEAACGRRPFDGLEVSELLSAHARRDPDRPRQINPGLSRSFEDVILQTLAKSPNGRFGSAPEMIGALEWALQHRGDPRRSETTAESNPDEPETTQWTRPDSVEKEGEDRTSNAESNFLQRCFQAALMLMTSTGAENGSDRCHYLNRSCDAPLPFR